MEIVNKVANSGLHSLNLEDYLPKEPIHVFDLKDYLFRGLILKEKDFREALKNHNWEQYQHQYLAITCSADAIIPQWAYMLVVSYAQPVAKDIWVGTVEEFTKHLTLKNISAVDAHAFADQRVIIKGCSDQSVEAAAYAEMTKVLRPVVKSIMYGEPCSNVPIFKKKP